MAIDWKCRLLSALKSFSEAIGVRLICVYIRRLTHRIHIMSHLPPARFYLHPIPSSPSLICTCTITPTGTPLPFFFGGRILSPQSHPDTFQVVEGRWGEWGDGAEGFGGVVFAVTVRAGGGGEVEEGVEELVRLGEGEGGGGEGAGGQ